MSTYKSLYNIIIDNNFSEKIFVNDSDAWLYNPDHQFIYNKLWIAQSQFIDCAPMEVYPNKYPVVFKPIINLIGMSRGFRKIIRNSIDKIQGTINDYFSISFLQMSKNSALS